VKLAANQTFYKVEVGPFASYVEYRQFCDDLWAAGGSCRSGARR